MTKYKNSINGEIVTEEFIIKEILNNFFTKEMLLSEEMEWVKSFEQMNNFVTSLWNKNNGIPYPYIEIKE